MVQKFEKKKTVINVTSIWERFEDRRAVVSHVFSWKDMKILAKRRLRGLIIATPSICDKYDC